MDEEKLYALLEAVLERMIPADEYPGAAEAGVGTYLGQRLVGDMADDLDRVMGLVAAFEAEAEAVHAKSFLDLSPEEQDALLDAIQAGRVKTKWPERPGGAVWFFAQVAAEGYYADPGSGGNHHAVSWKMIGFRNDDVPKHPLEFPRPPPPPDRDLYDAIIVGAGLAGGIVAGVLAEAGKHVLLIERGYDLDEQDYRRDHLRNHRLSLYGHNTGPSLEGHPRVYVDHEGKSHVIPPHNWRYSNNAMVVGGGALVFGGMAYRFMPDDFRMASRYGTPSGSSLTDWPISYEELEPAYDRAEWEIGVSGQAGLDPREQPRKRGYPMPALSGHAGRAQLDVGSERLGLNLFPVPLFINSQEYNGRPACARSNSCVGFPCPSNAKSGSHNTLLIRGLRTGNVKLVPRAQVKTIDTDSRGKVTGVTYVAEMGTGVEERTARARVVISSAGAVESARLLLNSANALEPQGLGNGSDHVGRNLQGHIYQAARGLMKNTVEEGYGPGPTRVTTRYSHGNPGIIGGGIMHDDFVVMPIAFWHQALPRELKRWGLENKRFMRDAYKRTVLIYGPIQEIPNPERRVTLDPKVRDRFGLPVVRLSGFAHPESIKTANFLRQRMVEWLEASDAERVWSYPIEDPNVPTGGQHQAGTCRMGDDPKNSVTDPWGRVHGHDNLYVVDASLHVTNGGMNPSLTIMALAFRCAEAIAQRI